MNTINGTSQINGYYNLTQIQLQKLLEEQEQAKQQECDSIQISQQAGNIASGLMQPPQFDSSILDNLVEDGTLTQEQADAVQSAFESNGINNTYKNTLTYVFLWDIDPPFHQTVQPDEGGIFISGTCLKPAIRRLCIPHSGRI